MPVGVLVWLCRFQSTLPIRGATYAMRDGNLTAPISIHAPHTGSDAVELASVARLGYFNPRSPYGERRARPACHRRTWYFNPRSPYGERLGRVGRHDGTLEISIHAPHTGSDSPFAAAKSAAESFQSTLPIRGATRPTSHGWRCDTYFNPRSPYGERLDGR